MLPATDRSYLLRLKNSRSASRLSLCSLQRKYAADDASFSSGQLCLLGLQALLDPCSFLGALSALHFICFILLIRQFIRHVLVRLPSLRKIRPVLRPSRFQSFLPTKGMLFFVDVMLYVDVSFFVFAFFPLVYLKCMFALTVA